MVLSLTGFSNAKDSPPPLLAFKICFKEAAGAGFSNAKDLPPPLLAFEICVKEAAGVLVLDKEGDV